MSAIQKIEAQTLAQNLKAKAELTDLGKALDKLITLKAPELKTIVTAAELETMVAAIESGTADNQKLTRFISIANSILDKV